MLPTSNSEQLARIDVKLGASKIFQTYDDREKQYKAKLGEENPLGLVSESDIRNTSRQNLLDFILLGNADGL